MKTKSRSLLTVILALLCTAALALGIGFLLSKAEKIKANAATVATNQPTFTTGAASGLTGNMVLSPYTDGFLLKETVSSTTLSTGAAEFCYTITVPAYTEYTCTYVIGGGMTVANVASGSGYINATGSITRRTSGGGSVPVGGNFSVYSQVDIPSGAQDQTRQVSNLIFVNDTGAPKPFDTYFDCSLTCASKPKAGRVVFAVWLEICTITATDLAVPKTTDTITMDYDSNPHTVNFEYAKVQPVKNDLDGGSHQYTTGYKNVDVTVDAVDGDGNTITAPTLNLDPNEGKGSITATDSGKYTVHFNLSSIAIGNDIEWVGGGTGEKTIVLTINKINPTVTPDVGTGPWYTSHDLYNDVTINTSTGDTPGTISWDSGKTLTAGTNNYGWTFTPTDTRNYNTKTGAEPITVAAIEVTGISATFNQGNAKFYTSNNLNDLKVRLAVDEVYNDGTTARLADGDYTLSGNISSAGTCTIKVKYTTKNTEYPAFEPYDDEFTVEITAVEITAIAATFNPGSNDIYLSNSLNDLNQYLTVTGTYNDGSTKTLASTDYSLTDPAALSLGTVTVTVTSDEDNTITDTFTVNVIPDIVPVQLPLPQANDYTYSGEELDVVGALTTLTEQDVIKYLDVSGIDSARRAGEYTVKFKIKDEFIAAGNVSWNTSNLSSLQGVTVSADGNSVEFKWNILKAKVAATWDDEECIWVPVIVGTLAETTEPNFLVQTYTNSDGKAFKNRSKLAGGRTYQVTATINAKYADNFEFDNATQTLIDSGDETYTYTPPYVPSLWEKIVAFLKKNWLWLVIAAAALILLIIIIVVAKKCHKTKEQREEIKARKEEERRRKEEERQRREEERRLQQERLEEERRLQREKLEAEREMARAKQEAELEKIRAQVQAGMAGAGMATMAMAQQPQQAMPTQVPVQTVDNDFLKEMRQQMAELRADNKATQEKLAALQNQQAMPTQYQQYPMYQQSMMPQYGDPTLARLEAQINAMQIEQRARYDAEQRIELAAMRAEQHVDRDSRHSVDLAAMREHFNGKVGYSNIPDYSQPNSVEALGAIVAAALKNIANGEVAATQVPELPQKSEQEPAAKYPSDAVITTTTTVDTTKNKSIRREENSDFDIDGFYDSIEE